MNSRLPLPRRILRFALALLALGAFFPAAFAANDIVLRLNTSTSAVLAGESTVATHAGEIDVLSLNWGVNSARTTTGTTTANASNLTLTKRVDKSSPTLMLAVFSGVHYPTAVLFVRNQTVSGTALDFFKITLTDIQINSYNTSASADGSLVETVSISFGTIKFDYQPQNADGTASGGVVSAGWNVTQNRQL